MRGAPTVDYFVQDGLGAIVLHPKFAENKVVYIGYVGKGENETRGAVVARGKLNLDKPSVEGLEVIWRAFLRPSMTLGKIVRLNDYGTPAAGTPFASQGGLPPNLLYGHRSPLGIAFDPNGRCGILRWHRAEAMS